MLARCSSTYDMVNKFKIFQVSKNYSIVNGYLLTSFYRAGMVIQQVHQCLSHIFKQVFAVFSKLDKKLTHTMGSQYLFLTFALLQEAQQTLYNCEFTGERERKKDTFLGLSLIWIALNNSINTSYFNLTLVIVVPVKLPNE